MPYPTPNLTTLQQQALSDIQSASISDSNGNTIASLLQKSVLRVLALVQAGFAYLHFKYIDYVALQATPFTATDEWLAGWMALKGVYKKGAVYAAGSVQFPGSSGTIGIGAQINRGDGASYITTSSASVSGSAVTVNVVALLSGAASTISPGDSCQLETPIGGINSSGVFLTSALAGADQETDASLKTRGLLAYAAPSQGGAATDFIQWALEVPGVTRAWCPPSTAGAGTVQVYFMMDQAEAAFQGIPQGTNGVAAAETRASAATGDQLTVANFIYPLRPVTSLVYALAPTPNPVNYTIANLVPDTPAIHAAIRTALLGMHQQVGSPGGSARPDGQTGGEIYESDWVAAIKSVPGIVVFDVTAPTGTVTSSTGAIPTLGTIAGPSGSF